MWERVEVLILLEEDVLLRSGAPVVGVYLTLRHVRDKTVEGWMLGLATAAPVVSSERSMAVRLRSRGTLTSI